MIWWVLIGLVAAGMLFIRFAPSDDARWHQPVTVAQHKDGQGFAVKFVSAQPGVLARIDAAAAALPRTTRLAGSVKEGRITYVTRSKWAGFPDYTTIEETDGQIRMFARLRFGKSDFGVNAARLERLVAAAEPAG